MDVEVDDPPVVEEADDVPVVEVLDDEEEELDDDEGPVVEVLDDEEEEELDDDEGPVVAVVEEAVVPEPPFEVPVALLELLLALDAIEPERAGHRLGS